MAQPLHCHGHAGQFRHQHGADLHCSHECREQYRAAQLMFEEALRQAGFSQVKDVPNLWLKDGVHLSIDEVIREGMDQTLAKHRAAVEARL